MSQVGQSLSSRVRSSRRNGKVFQHHSHASFLVGTHTRSLSPHIVHISLLGNIQQGTNSTRESSNNGLHQAHPLKAHRFPVALDASLLYPPVRMPLHRRLPSSRNIRQGRDEESPLRPLRLQWSADNSGSESLLWKQEWQACLAGQVR